MCQELELLSSKYFTRVEQMSAGSVPRYLSPSLRSSLLLVFPFFPDYEKVSGKFLSACFVSIDRTTVHNMKKILALMNFS